MNQGNAMISRFQMLGQMLALQTNTKGSTRVTEKPRQSGRNSGISWKAQAQISDETTITSAHDEMHIKTPSSIFFTVRVSNWILPELI